MKTYKQLYWDKEFVEKRIKEQNDYIQQLNTRWSFNELTLERYSELRKQALHVRDRFRTQLFKIYDLK